MFQATLAHWRRAIDSDIFYSFRRSPVTVIAAIVTGVFIFICLFAPWVSPHNPYDLETVSLIDAFNPPVWYEDGSWTYILGTDDQGRGILSAIIYGARLSLWVGLVVLCFLPFSASASD